MMPNGRALRSWYALALLPAVTLLGCAWTDDPPEPRTLRLAVWTQAGPFTSSLSEHLTASIPGVRVVGEPTPGSFFVVDALQNGSADLGFAQADVVYMAYRRKLEPSGEPHRELRAIAVLWVNSVFAVVRSPGPIETIGDLRGKRVGTVPQGSSGEQLARLTLKAHGLTYGDVQPQFHGVENLAGKLMSGEIDAAIATGAILTPSLAALSGSGQVRLLPVERRVSQKMRAEYPFIKLMRIAASDIPGRTEDLETVGADGVLVCRDDLDDALVHAMTKELFALLPRLEDRVSRSIDPERAPAAPIPLHPGAARYYRERQILR